MKLFFIDNTIQMFDRNGKSIANVTNPPDPNPNGYVPTNYDFSTSKDMAYFCRLFGDGVNNMGSLIALDLNLKQVWTVNRFDFSSPFFRANVT